MNENIQKENTEPENTQQTEAGQEFGKLFTQEEVNRIVAERIKRTREKAEKDHAKAIEDLNTDLSQTLDTKAADLTRRENTLSCREYLIEKGYPVSLLEIIPTDNIDEFRAKANKVREEFAKTLTGPPPLKSTEGRLDPDDIKKAFSNPAHVPRKF